MRLLLKSLPPKPHSSTPPNARLLAPAAFHPSTHWRTAAAPQSDNEVLPGQQVEVPTGQALQRLSEPGASVGRKHSTNEGVWGLHT